MIAITNEYLLLFAALAFGSLCIIFLVHYKKMVSLEDTLTNTRHAKENLLESLAAASNREKKLQASIDRLIMRRDDLLSCLQSAKTDEEKVACIKNLIEPRE